RRQRAGARDRERSARDARELVSPREGGRRRAVARAAPGTEMSDSAVQRLFAQAQREQPRLPPADSALRARVRRMLAEAPDAIETLSFGDLLLADGCAKGDPASLAEFERVVMPRVRQAIAKIDGSAPFLD